MYTRLVRFNYDVRKANLKIELFPKEDIANKYFISIIVSEKQPKEASFHESQ
jgi:hypothetical protein